MNLTDFDRYFEALHGIPPFRWQRRLAEHAIEKGWPGVVKLPTGAGKTALIDIAVFHLALDPQRARRRIFFVVDRRLVVDEAYRRAKHIEERLATATGGILAEVANRLRSLSDETDAPPLIVKRLRGGVPREKTFIETPLQPVVVLSTVDQVGSRLLFRGYGVSEYMRPIHAALVGIDSLILLDEAHLSRPFVETLGWVRRYQKAPEWAKHMVGKPLTVVEMTATPPPGEKPFELIAEDNQDNKLVMRLGASKPAELIEVLTNKDDRHSASAALAQSLSEHAERLMNDLLSSVAAPVVGVVANRVMTARLAWEKLKAAGDADVVLLTGRMRPLDRAKLETDCHQRIRAGRDVADNPRPLFVVATQTIEVGADLDFDGLVTESAALDALRQRFGRLNRLGERNTCLAAILHDKQAAKDDPVYGSALVKTWKWLKTKAAKSRKAKFPICDFGIRALESHLPNGDERKELLTPTRQAPVLMPAHMDMLVQTSPAPAVEPDIALLLHGAGSQGADVQLVWRADLPTRLSKDNEKAVLDTLALLPPMPEEAMSLPIAAARRMLAHLELEELADVEGGTETATGGAVLHVPWVVRWRGPGKSSVGSMQEIRPGDTLVLPAAYGGLDRIAGTPPLPLDVGDIAARQRRGQVLLRLHPALATGWFDLDAPPMSVERACSIIRELLMTIADSENVDTDVRSAVCALAGLTGIVPDVRDVLLRLAEVGVAYAYPDEAYPTGLLMVEPRNASRAFSDEDDSSSLTREVALQAHCDGVGSKAGEYATRMGLLQSVCADVALAGHVHDLGKTDPRFQAWLRGGDRGAARRATAPLAKSGMRALDAAGRERARKLAGYPRGSRHECYSVAILRAHPKLLEHSCDAELVAYLAGTHHGRGRPFMPTVDDAGMSVRFDFDDHTHEWTGQHGLDRLDSGWTEGFWCLVQRYGYWGLAWLETLVRLADHRQSALEMEN